MTTMTTSTRIACLFDVAIWRKWQDVEEEMMATNDNDFDMDDLLD
jgi:hypothetical protein